jgi:hypothetical protein
VTFRRLAVILQMALLLCALMLIPPLRIEGYATGSRWNMRSVSYMLDPNNDSTLLGANSADEIVRAGLWWNVASSLGITRQGWDPNIPNARIVSTENFQVRNPCTGGNPGAIDQRFVALTCIDAASGIISRTRTYFNVSGTYQWVRDGTISPTQVDLFKHALHEFGHWFFLDDWREGDGNHPDAIMQNLNNTQPGEDDKHGATLLYGPWTRFETWSANGEIDRPSWLLNGLRNPDCNTGLPVLGPVFPELGVPLVDGTNNPYNHRHARFAGCSTLPGSYAYYLLYTSFNDDRTERHYFTIQSGWKLGWWQYNYEQLKMGVDLIMVDSMAMSRRCATAACETPTAIPSTRQVEAQSPTASGSIPRST